MQLLADATYFARAYGLRKAARRFVATYLHGERRTYLVRSNYVSIAATSVPDIGLTFRFARPEDVTPLAADTGFPAGVLQAWLDRGDLLFLALRDGRPVALRCDATTVVTPWVRPVLRLPPDQVFMVDVFTHPAFRRQGLTRQVRVAQAREMLRRGYRAGWGLQKPLNRQALAAFDRTPDMLERVALLSRTSTMGFARFCLDLCRPLSEHPIGQLLDVGRALCPAATRIAVLFNPGTRMAHPAAVSSIHREAASRAVEVQLVGVTEAEAQAAAFQEGFESIRASRADAIIVVDDGLYRQHRRLIAELARRYRVPAVYERPEYVAAGGLASDSTAHGDPAPLPAELDGTVLRRDPPPGRPAGVAVNLGTARLLGLAIPPSLRRQAELVIA